MTTNRIAGNAIRAIEPGAQGLGWRGLIYADNPEVQHIARSWLELDLANPGSVDLAMYRHDQEMAATQARVEAALGQVDFEAGIALNIMMLPTMFMGGMGAGYGVSRASLSTIVPRVAAAESGNVASNAALHVNHINLLRTTEAANPLVDSLRATGGLPANYATKADAALAGWQPGKALENFLPGGQIGGDVFRNSTNLVPGAAGRIWYEADVGLVGTMSRANQPGTRLLYSNEGHMYVTFDHYATAHPIGRYK